MSRKHLLALALPAFLVSVASPVWMGPVEASPKGKEIFFEANTTFQRLVPQPDGTQPAQTGEITGAGILNSTFVTDHSTDNFPPPVNNETVGSHTDKYVSKTSTHVDPDGVTRPDSFNVKYTIVVLFPDATRTATWVTFQGQMSDGTGIFAGATGVFSGHAHSVQPPPSGVQYAFQGEVGGEVHLAPRP
jgi:hypothetical protein